MSLFRKLFSKKNIPQNVEKILDDNPKIDQNLKFLITGLGNIGTEYSGTRHNIGFDVVDFLALKFDVSFKSVRYGFLGAFKHKGRFFYLLKPNTYMNLSGQAVRYWLQKEKINTKNLLVVSDDLNINFGQVKIKAKGSAGGHNGLKNIEQLLGSSAYPRLRVGIGDRFSKGRQVDFVLGKWSDEEGIILQEIISHAADAVLSFGSIGLERTMNSFNKDLFKKKEAKNKNNKKDPGT